jgi:hypothetical protein
MLQIDDPGLPDWWDMLKPEPTVEAYRKFAKLRIGEIPRIAGGLPVLRIGSSAQSRIRSAISPGSAPTSAWMISRSAKTEIPAPGSGIADRGER